MNIIQEASTMNYDTLIPVKISQQMKESECQQ